MQAIDCRLYASDRAVEISTAENSHEAMHPADQFEAFAKLLASGLSEQQVASRFGVSVLTVQRRMTLASLAPRFIALFRADKISMDQLQALAHSPDHAVQIAAWDSLSEYQRSPYMLKQALTKDEVESDSRLAKFVGLDMSTRLQAVRCAVTCLASRTNAGCRMFPAASAGPGPSGSCGVGRTRSWLVLG